MCGEIGPSTHQHMHTLCSALFWTSPEQLALMDATGNGVVASSCFQLVVRCLGNNGDMTTTYQYHILRHDPLQLLQVLCFVLKILASSYAARL